MAGLELGAQVGEPLNVLGNSRKRRNEPYQDMIRETSTDYAPWYVIPADHKHVAWLVVSSAIIEALEGLKLEYPKVTGKALEELKKIERALKPK